jgi:hypothetical protein
MNLYEYADIIDARLCIIRYANQDGRFSADFEYSEIKQDSCLLSEYGRGKTPQEALNDYKNRIVGKTLVFHAGNKHLRREYIVPSKMEDV